MVDGIATDGVFFFLLLLDRKGIYRGELVFTLEKEEIIVH